MINTLNIKLQQLANGAFKVGSGNEVIVIVGSCRAVPYLNYIDKYNNDNRFTIYFIDPFNWNWNLKDERVDFETELFKQESNEFLLNAFRSCKTFIHEYYNHFGMFCMNNGAEKNIYQFGLNPEIDICIPNFNNLFILFNDILTFDVDLRKKAIQDKNVIGKLSEETIRMVKEISNKNIEKFYEVCRLSSLPEMENFFRNNHELVRLYWTSNHVSKAFTMRIMALMTKKYLNLDAGKIMEIAATTGDLFANNYTFLTKYDGFEWEEEFKETF